MKRLKMFLQYMFMPMISVVAGVGGGSSAPRGYICSDIMTPFTSGVLTIISDYP